MIFDCVELHNTAEIKDGPDGGVRLQRVPDSVRQHLNPGAKERVLRPACAEIRFVAEPGDTTELTLAGVDGGLRVVPFFGPFRHGEPFVVGSEPKAIKLTMPERILDSLPALEKMRLPFSPRVCRLMLWGGRVEFRGVKGKGVRPPTAEELPSLRYLSYGTSITHGAAASWPHLAYVAQVARRLGADLLNFGVGGSCHCEAEFADYLASREDWDVATLALSVNMMGFTPEEFRKRVTYLVDTVAGSNTDRPVACITLYRYFGDREVNPGTYETPSKADLFREILREAAAQCPHPNVHVFEGREMLTDLGGLTSDLIHPAEDGMIQMGENIARRLLPLLACRRVSPRPRA